MYVLLYVVKTGRCAGRQGDSQHSLVGSSRRQSPGPAVPGGHHHSGTPEPPRAKGRNASRGARGIHQRTMVGSYLARQSQPRHRTWRPGRATSSGGEKHHSLVDEMGLDELDREGRFPDTTPSDDDEFVLAQELCLQVGASGSKSASTGLIVESPVVELRRRVQPVVERGGHFARRRRDEVRASEEAADGDLPWTCCCADPVSLPSQGLSVLVRVQAWARREQSGQGPRFLISIIQLLAQPLVGVQPDIAGAALTVMCLHGSAVQRFVYPCTSSAHDATRAVARHLTGPFVSQLAVSPPRVCADAAASLALQR